MEAPIPASALIHSATLVAAGVYLMLRFKHLLIPNNNLTYILITSGILTASIFSLIAALQTDIKKLLAYSTIANCGFMYFLIGIGCFKLTVIYFAIHGLLKAILFLLAGNLILLNNHNQDIYSWSKNNINSVYTSILFTILFLYLNATQLSLFFDIKHFYVVGSVNTDTRLWMDLFIPLYTIHSFLYGTKLVSLLSMNNLNTSKNVLASSPHTDNLNKSVYIFALYNLIFIEYFYKKIGLIFHSATYINYTDNYTAPIIPAVVILLLLNISLNRKTIQHLYLLSIIGYIYIQNFF